MKLKPVIYFCIEKSLLWVPPLVTLILCGIKIKDFTDLFLHVEGSFFLTYEGQDQIYTVRTKKLNISPLKHQIVCLYSNLEDEHQEPIISIQDLLINLQPNCIKIIGEKGKGIVRKIPEGWSVQNLAPKITTEGGEDVYDILLRDIHLDYHDQSVLHSYINEIHLLSSGDKLIGKGKITLPGMGIMPIDCSGDFPNLFELKISCKNADPTSLKPFLESYLSKDQKKYLKTEGIQLTGMLKIFYKKDQPLKFKGDIDTKIASFKVLGNEKIDNIEGKIVCNESGFQGTLQGLINNNLYQFEGCALWKPQLNIFGNIKADVSDLEKLPQLVKKNLPSSLKGKNLQITASIKLDKGNILAQGVNYTGELCYQDHQVKDLSSDFIYNDNELFLNIKKGILEKGNISGRLNLSLTSKKIEGLFTCKEIQLNNYLKKQGYPYIGMNPTATLYLKGPLESPIGSIYLSTPLAYRKEHEFFLGNVEAVAQWKNNFLEIERFKLDGPLVQMGLVGSLDVFKRKFSGEARLFSGDLTLLNLMNVLSPEIHLDSESRCLAKISGPIGKGLAMEGNIDLYNLNYGFWNVPIVSSSFSQKGEQVHLDQVLVCGSEGILQGKGVFNIDTHVFNAVANAKGIQLSDFIHEDITGILNFSDVHLNGSMDKWSIQGKANSKNLSVKEISINQLEVPFTLNNNSLEIDSLKATSGRGKIDAKAYYNFKNEDLRVDYSIIDFPLAQLPFSKNVLPLKGLGKGSGHIVVHKKELQDFLLSTNGQNIVINRNPMGLFGGGVKFEKGKWNAHGIIANDPVNSDRTFQVSEFHYDPKSQSIQSECYIDNIRYQDLLKIGNYYCEDLIRNIENPWKNLLTTLQSDVSGTIEIKGNLKNPNLNLKELKLSKLNLDDQPAGEMSFSLSKQNQDWILSELNWKEKNGILKGSAALEDNKKIYVFAQIKDFNTLWVSKFINQVPAIEGLIDSELQVTGELQNPKAEGKIMTQLLKNYDLETHQSSYPLLINIDHLNYKDHHLVLQGDYKYLGINGILNGNYFTDKERMYQSNIEAQLIPTSLKTLNHLLPSIDPSKSNGMVNGKLTMKQTPQGIDIQGKCETVDSTIGLLKANTYLKKVNASAEINFPQFNLNVIGESSESGVANLNVKGKILNDQINKHNLWDTLAKISVNGTFNTNKFSVNENKSFVDLKSQIDSSLAIEGSLLNPILKGKVNTNKTKVVFKPNALQDTDKTLDLSQSSPFDIKFKEIDLHLNEPFQFNMNNKVGGISGLQADMSLKGKGTLNGSVEFPSVNIVLETVFGQFTDPRRKIQINPGGLIKASYYSVNENLSMPNKIDINMQGRTYMSDKQATGEVEYYDVLLTAKGNLLEEGGLIIEGESNPSGLSQNRIRSILFQEDIFRSLVQGQSSSSLFRDFGLNTGNQQSLDSTLAGVLFPFLINPFSDTAASFLGIDYISIDYDPILKSFISIGKSLSKVLSIHFSKSIDFLNFNKNKDSDLISSNQSDFYRIRLNYRVPKWSLFKGSTTFNITYGTNNNGPPLQVGVEFTKKF